MSRYTQGEGGRKGATLRCEQTNLSINCHECHLCATATIAMSNRPVFQFGNFFRDVDWCPWWSETTDTGKAGHMNGRRWDHIAPRPPTVVVANQTSRPLRMKRPLIKTTAGTKKPLFTNTNEIHHSAPSRLPWAARVFPLSSSSSLPKL